MFWSHEKYRQNITPKRNAAKKMKMVFVHVRVHYPTGSSLQHLENWKSGSALPVLFWRISANHSLEHDDRL